MSGDGLPLLRFLEDYYNDEITAQSDHDTLVVDWMDLYRFDPDLANRALENPRHVRDDLELTLASYGVGQPMVHLDNLDAAEGGDA